jgi:hypothetical protein
MKRLVAGFPQRQHGFAPGSGKWDLWWTKWRRGRFSPSTSVSLPKPFIWPQSPGAVSRCLAKSWSPVQGVLPAVLDLVTEVKRRFYGGGQGLNWAVEPKKKKSSFYHCSILMYPPFPRKTNAVANIRQHIIIASIFKLDVSSLTRIRPITEEGS